MDLRNSRPVIIAVGIGGWYGKGVERLERSLNFVGSPIPWMTWKDIYPPSSLPHEQFPYYFKIAAFEWALYRGYTHVLYLDASFWAVKSPMPLFDVIADHGFYCFSSGYNLAQTVSDRVLHEYGMTRDQAEIVTEWATGAVGINFENPNGKALYAKWKEYMDQGWSKGGRNHDGQSSDPRFRFHRQDQSCFSLAIHNLGLMPPSDHSYIAYYSTNYDPANVIFFIQGIA